MNPYEYFVISAEARTDLNKTLESFASDRWEPINMQVVVETELTQFFVMLRRLRIDSE